MNEFIKNLKLKLLIIFFVPAVGMLYFSSGYLYDKIIQYDNTQYLDKISKYAGLCDELISQLQRERGLSIAYLSKSSDYFSQKLKEQRCKSDTAYRKVEEYLRSGEAPQKENELKNVVNIYSSIDSFRKTIDEKSCDMFRVLSYYSNMISSLIRSTDILRVKYVNEKFLRTIVSFKRVMMLAELSGRERALVSYILEKREYDGKIENILIKLEMELKQINEELSKDSPLELFTLYRRYIDIGFEKHFFDIKHKIIFKKRFDELDSKKWWDISSKYIEAFHRTNRAILFLLLKMKSDLKVDALSTLTISMLIWLLSITALFFLLKIVSKIVNTFGKLLSQIDEQKKIYKSFSEFSELLIYNDDKNTILTSMCVILNQTDKFRNVWIAKIDENGDIVPYITENISVSTLNKEIRHSKKAKLFCDMRRVLKEGRQLISYPENRIEAIEGGVKFFIIYPIMLKNSISYLLVLSINDNTEEFDINMNDMIGRMCGAVTSAFEKIDIKNRELRLRNELRITASAFDTYEAITIADIHGKIIRVNEAFTKITGYTEDEVIGKNPNILKSDRHDKNFYIKMWDSIRKNGYWKGEIYNRRKNGEIYPEMLSISAIKDENGDITHYVAHFFDISDMKEAQQKAEYRALHDPLTDLYNRQQMKEDLDRIYNEYFEIGEYGAFIFFDLDNFKHINDFYGHDIGDMVLREIAHILKKSFYRNDNIYRVAGDEFAVIATRLGKDRDVAIAKATMCVEMLMSLFKAPLKIEDNNIEISFSIGIKIFPDMENDVKEIMVDADIAMYHAKKSGKNMYHFFDDDLDERSKNYLLTKNELSRALLQNDQLRIVYQPKVQISSGEISGFEALVRWYHPIRGCLSPNDFIYATAGNQLGYKLNEYVLRRVCSQIIQWKRIYEKFNWRIAVNISSEQFADPKFEDDFLSLIDECGLDPNLLELEIVEDALLGDIERSIKTIKNLKSRGIKFSIDDFGTGYSSLNYLYRLPVDTLKLDKSFISHIFEGKKNASIVKLIIKTAKIFGMKTVAEGVENARVLKFLKAYGCDEYQGYYYSKPMKPEEIEKLLKA
jgi:diguanylate cyclase (GGDEF)-like protein/PAS domain S-box-containing protein